MKNTRKVFGIIAIIAVIGFSMTACEEPNSNGTAPTITTTSLPNGTLGTAYSQQLAATGDATITWSIETGTLPNGLTLSTTGVISGTPTTANTFNNNFTVKATNATGNNTKALSIVISNVDWWTWFSPNTDNTATITISSDADGVCTVTVSGTAIDDPENDWYINAGCNYQGEKNVAYKYTFEAWTESGERTFRIEYWSDGNDIGDRLQFDSMGITNERKTYTKIGKPLPTGRQLPFIIYCANQTGKFYVKMLSIEKNN